MKSSASERSHTFLSGVALRNQCCTSLDVLVLILELVQVCSRTHLYQSADTGCTCGECVDKTSP